MLLVVDKCNGLQDNGRAPLLCTMTNIFVYQNKCSLNRDANVVNRISFKIRRMCRNTFFLTLSLLAINWFQEIFVDFRYRRSVEKKYS